MYGRRPGPVCGSWRRYKIQLLYCSSANVNDERRELRAVRSSIRALNGLARMHTARLFPAKYGRNGALTLPPPKPKPKPCTTLVGRSVRPSVGVLRKRRCRPLLLAARMEARHWPNMSRVVTYHPFNKYASDRFAKASYICTARRDITCQHINHAWPSSKNWQESSACYLEVGRHRVPIKTTTVICNDTVVKSQPICDFFHYQKRTKFPANACIIFSSLVTMVHYLTKFKLLIPSICAERRCTETEQSHSHLCVVLVQFCSSEEIFNIGYRFCSTL